MRRHFRFRLWDLPDKSYPPSPDNAADMYQKVISHMLECHNIQAPGPIVDHTPSNSAIHADLLRSYDTAYCIHIMRDPRAVISSFLRTDWGLTSLHEALECWLQRNAISEHIFEAAQDNPRIIVLGYETFCADPTRVLTYLENTFHLDGAKFPGEGAVLIPKYTQAQHKRILEMPKDEQLWRKTLQSEDIQQIETKLADTYIGQHYGFLANRNLPPLSTRPSYAEKLRQKIRSVKRRRIMGVEKFDLKIWPGQPPSRSQDISPAAAI